MCKTLLLLLSVLQFGGGAHGHEYGLLKSDTPLKDHFTYYILKAYGVQVARLSAFEQVFDPDLSKEQLRANLFTYTSPSGQSIPLESCFSADYLPLQEKMVLALQIISEYVTLYEKSIYIDPGTSYCFYKDPEGNTKVFIRLLRNSNLSIHHNGYTSIKASPDQPPAVSFFPHIVNIFRTALNSNYLPAYALADYSMKNLFIDIDTPLEYISSAKVLKKHRLSRPYHPICMMRELMELLDLSYLPPIKQKYYTERIKKHEKVKCVTRIDEDLPLSMTTESLSRSSSFAASENISMHFDETVPEAFPPLSLVSSIIHAEDNTLPKRNFDKKMFHNSHIQGRKYCGTSIYCQSSEYNSEFLKAKKNRVKTVPRIPRAFISRFTTDELASEKKASKVKSDAVPEPEPMSELEPQPLVSTQPILSTEFRPKFRREMLQACRDLNWEHIPLMGFLCSPGASNMVVPTLIHTTVPVPYEFLQWLRAIVYNVPSRLMKVLHSFPGQQYTLYAYFAHVFLANYSPVIPVEIQEKNEIVLSRILQLLTQYIHHLGLHVERSRSLTLFESSAHHWQNLYGTKFPVSAFLEGSIPEFKQLSEFQLSHSLIPNLHHTTIFSLIDPKYSINSINARQQCNSLCKEEVRALHNHTEAIYSTLYDMQMELEGIKSDEAGSKQLQEKLLCHADISIHQRFRHFFKVWSSLNAKEKEYPNDLVRARPTLTKEVEARPEISKTEKQMESKDRYSDQLVKEEGLVNEVKPEVKTTFRQKAAKLSITLTGIFEKHLGGTFVSMMKFLRAEVPYFRESLYDSMGILNVTSFCNVIQNNPLTHYFTKGLERIHRSELLDLCLFEAKKEEIIYWLGQFFKFDHYHKTIMASKEKIELIVDSAMNSITYDINGKGKLESGGRGESYCRNMLQGSDIDQLNSILDREDGISALHRLLVSSISADRLFNGKSD